MYTTINYVRRVSGLQDDTNIIDTTVQAKIDAAAGMFDSAICNRYTLPMAFHRQNKITFSGTGSDSGTMTVTINGSNYTIAITSGLTAAQCADLFRESVYNNGDFIATLCSEKDEEGEVVEIVSVTDSGTSITTANAEVNITSAGGTVQGITGTAGLRSDRFAPFVSQLVAEIAASLLLSDEYGVEGQDSNKDDDKRMKRTQTTLLQLQGDPPEGFPVLKLLDEVTKVELSQTTGDNPSFFPTAASGEDEDDPTDIKVGINSKF